jgi:hypothetical protein
MYTIGIVFFLSKTLDKDHFTLGKAFAEGYPRQTFYRQKVLCRILFSDTRKKLCRVSKNTQQINNRKKPQTNTKRFFKLCEQLSNHYPLPYPSSYNFSLLF